MGTLRGPGQSPRWLATLLGGWGTLSAEGGGGGGLPGELLKAPSQKCGILSRLRSHNPASCFCGLWIFHREFLTMTSCGMQLGSVVLR